MAWNTPKTNWQSTDVPTAADFNRIEDNTKALNETKEALINTLPISKGGTGAVNAASARANLGLGEAAVLNYKPIGYPQSNYGLLLFKTNSSGTSGFFQAGPNSGFQAYWGSVHLGSDEKRSVSFSSHSGTGGGSSIVNGNYSVVTGMVSDGTGVHGNVNRNGVFIFNKSATGFVIYNDGEPGTAYWFVIGM